MTTKTFVRLAEIAREHDLNGRAREADAITDAMIRIAQESATGHWWDGVKQVGQGLADDTKALGNAVSAPFEAAGAGASAAWNQGIKNAPAAAGQAAGQAWGRAKDYTQQEFSLYGRAAPALAGPGGTGLPGAVVQDAAHGVGQALQGEAQGFVNNAVGQQDQAKQAANIAQWVQQAIQTHKSTGKGWDVISSAIQYGGLSPDNQARLRQQFAQAAAQFEPH